MTKDASWRRLGSIAPNALVPTRLELHYAGQIPASLGIARARPEPDFGHHSLSWDPNERALLSAIVPAKRPYRAGIRFRDRTLLLLDGAGSKVETLALAGRTLAEGLAWLSRATAQLNREPEVALELPAQELPTHPLAGGARFGKVEDEPAAELEGWYANLARVLGRHRESESGSPVRVWSHHFDLDTVISLGGERTLGLGLSPGDEFYAEPYLYVLPSGVREGSRAPELEPPIEWRTETWTGAVLRGSEIAKIPESVQEGAVESFFRTTASIVRPLVG